jgi:3-deoxy-manno-octulosonate cytidylyltransferase (CMP-KDO synthetase)
METYIGIIPARYESSRFPGKPLCDILGKPMIYRVYKSVMKWDKWKKVYVATDSEKIYNECSKYDIPCLMTREDHTDCLDRAAEVVNILEEKGEGANKYIVIQGDEPLFNTKTLDVDLSPSIINFYTETVEVVEKYDTNTVKVIVSNNNKAIYFSRYSLPYHDEKTKRTYDAVKIYKQICAYVFTGEMLKIYNSLKPTFLENMEGIGLNRLIENDIEIHMRHTKYDSLGVDVPTDRYRVIAIMKKYYSDKGGSITDDGEVIDCDGYVLRRP